LAPVLPSLVGACELLDNLASLECNAVPSGDVALLLVTTEDSLAGRLWRVLVAVPSTETVAVVVPQPQE
jgi:hypothetical protein